MSFLTVVGALLSLIIILVILVLAVKPARHGLHAYVYGRWTKQYVWILTRTWFPRFGAAGRRYISNRYHGKVLTHEQAAAIINLDHDICKQEIEQIIPYPLARTIVMTAEPEIAVYECACRGSRENPCEPTQVCMLIGKSYVDFILKNHPDKSRRLSRGEALDLLKAEHERGHLHSAWFKDVLGDRFYCICNCCSCCCGGIEAMTTYKAPMMISSGYVASIDTEKCRACGKCSAACPFGAIAEVGGGVFAVSGETCMGCEVCAVSCKNDAITFARDTAKPEPLDVRFLS